MNAREPRCFECLTAFRPGETRVMCVTEERGEIHGVIYPAGATIYAHESCLAAAGGGPA